MSKQAIFNFIGYAILIAVPVFFIIKATQAILKDGKQPIVVTAQAPIANDKPLSVYAA